MISRLCLMGLKALIIVVFIHVGLLSSVWAEASINPKGNISFDIQDMALKDVFQIFSEMTAINIVCGESIKGVISLRLDDVPWEEAFDMILKSKGLDKRMVGDTI